jgi:hypothetical protein
MGYKFFWCVEINNGKPIKAKNFLTVGDLVKWIKENPQDREFIHSTNPIIRRLRRQYEIDKLYDIIEL